MGKGMLGNDNSEGELGASMMCQHFQLCPEKPLSSLTPTYELDPYSTNQSAVESKISYLCYLHAENHDKAGAPSPKA